MEILLKLLFWINIFVAFWAMIGYPLSLLLITKLKKNKNDFSLNKEDSYIFPDVTIMIVAHNEEKVIKEKLFNVLSLDYPSEKLKIMVASDASTDATNQIVETFMKENKEIPITLYESVQHMGKTNAQNEAQKLVDTEILVLTDANSMFEADAVKELVQMFKDSEVAYVTGKLCYSNAAENATSTSEGFYWKMDLWCRKIESDIQTITAGNGAIYACRNELYKIVTPIECHDSAMPVLYALDRKKAVFCDTAVAYEKAGEQDKDEFKRKVRMNRLILKAIMPNKRILNIGKYKWFSYFYFGHRTCRYLLWCAHFMILATNILLCKSSLFYTVTLGLQLLFYIIALMTKVFHIQNKLFRMVYYYCIMVAAQWCGVINMITGKSKPVWEKAESTR